MKKTLLAITIPTILFANSVSAVKLYQDEVNTFSIGGHISVGLAGSEEGNTKVESLSPRINIGATRDLGEGFMLDLRSEWWVNVLEGGEQAFTTRLGYIGLTHDTYGRAVIGTQWSPYYSVAGIAERTVAFGNQFLYNNHYNLGTARAEKMLSYSKNLELGEAGTVIMAAGWQGEHTEDNADYDTRLQAALTYQIMDFSLGYAYNSGDVDDDSVGSTQQAVSNVASAKYGDYGQGLYVAAVYANNEYMYQYKSSDVLEETVQIEAIAAYALENSLNFSINYETVEDNKIDNTVYSQLAFNVEYDFLSNVRGYTGYQIDLGSEGAYDKPDDNKFALGVRVFL
ncbi:MAG: porin [Psychromonas sp.]